MKSNKKAVVLSSGGLDSTTVMAMVADDGFDIYSLSFSYGQRHAFELEAAQNVAGIFGVKEHLVVQVDLRKFGGSALTDRSIDVRTLQIGNAEKLLAFLAEVGPQRQFFPAYSADDFFTERAALKDLRASDILAAYRDGMMVGIMAGWNQIAEVDGIEGILGLRQIVVIGLPLGVVYALHIANPTKRALTG